MMLLPRLFAGSVLVALGCLSPIAQHAAEHPDAGYVSLFDGKSLEGWTQLNGTATYRVEGDAIVGKTNEGSPNSFLCTDKLYGDFDLMFEVKVDDRLNSGVQIRSRTGAAGEPGRVNGPQVEIEASGANGLAGYIYGETAGGWMTPEKDRVRHAHFNDGAWNAYRVLAIGPNIKVWINGRLISKRGINRTPTGSSDCRCTASEVDRARSRSCGAT